MSRSHEVSQTPEEVIPVSPGLTPDQVSFTNALNNFAVFQGMRSEDYTRISLQHGLPPPTEAQLKAALAKYMENRTEIHVPKTPPKNGGGFYLGRSSTE